MSLSELTGISNQMDDLPNHHYRANLALENVAGNVKARVRRLAKEHSDLSHCLPLSLSSSVWMRASASRMDVVRFMISGPEDTPYSGGLFIFDAYFPETYPEKVRPDRRRRDLQ
jgi:hypothetical protein